MIFSNKEVKRHLRTALVRHVSSDEDASKLWSVMRYNMYMDRLETTALYEKDQNALQDMFNPFSMEVKPAF